MFDMVIRPVAAMLARWAARGDGCAPARRDGVLFEYGAGRVRVRQLPGGIYWVEYSGLIGEAAFAALRARAVVQTAGAAAILLDMCPAVWSSLPGPLAPINAYVPNHAPSAVLCRPEHLVAWQAYGAAVSTRGITCVAFSGPERAKAMAMLRAFARPE